jgi:zinc protease
MRVERKVLSNGMVLLVVANHASPSAHIRCLLRAGSAFDEERPGLACLAARLLDAGTEHRTRAAIYEELDFLGATLEVGEDRDTVSLDAHLLVRDFARVVEILGDILAHPVFPEEELARQRASLVTSIRADDQDTEAVCENRLVGEIFRAGHPYHHPVKGKEETVRAISRDEIVTFSRKFHSPEGAIIAVSGDLNPEDALARLEDAMAGLTAKAERPPLAVPTPDPLEEEVRAVVRLDDKAQADIGFGHRGIRRSDPDYYAFLVMNHALGQSGMGGRLGTEIREKRGLAYYAYSAITAGVGAGTFRVRAGVNPTRVAEAVEVMFEELARVVAKGVTEAEVDESKRYLIGSLPRRLETHSRIARHMASAELFELGTDFADRFPRLIGAISAADCSRVAMSRLEPEKGVLVIAGPHEEGEAQILADRLERSV